MRHSLQLSQEVLRKMPVLIKHGRATQADKADLAREVHMQELVMKSIKMHMTDRLFWRGRVWLAYMHKHAQLQIRRYGGEISEAGFHGRCRGLRRWRDAQLANRSVWKRGVA